MALENYNIIIEKYEWEEQVTPTGNLYEFYMTMAGSPHFNDGIGEFKCINLKYYGGQNAYIVLWATGSPYGGGINSFQLGTDGKYYLLIDSYNPPTLTTIKNLINNSGIGEFEAYIPDGSGYRPIQIGHGYYENFAFVSGWDDDDKLPNFFSSQVPKFLGAIDLESYLIDIGNLEYNFDNADSEKGKASLYYEDSDISFTCSGIQNKSSLYDFFQINEDTARIGYMILITNKSDDSLIWRGVVNQDSIEENFEPSDSSEQIKFQGLGFLKEFKNYYTQKKTLHTDFIRWDYEQSYQAKRFETFIKEDIFRNSRVNIILEDTIKDYYIRRSAGIFPNMPSVDKSYTMFKTSYDRIYNGNTSDTKWIFFTKLCTAMGWVFYFMKDNFYIKNRSSDSQFVTPVDLDYNKFLEYTAMKTKPQDGFSSIMLTDGQAYMGKNCGVRANVNNGNYIYMFTKLGDDLKVAIPFQEVLFGTYKTLYVGANYRHIKYYNEDSNWFRYMIVQETNPAGNYGASLVTIPQNELLRLDAGDSGLEGTNYDSSMGVNNLWTLKSDHTGLGDRDFWFTGNHGNCLYKTVNGKYYTYQHHTKSSLFADNFAKYYSSNINLANKISVKYDGLLLEPLVVFNIINSEELSGEWTVVKISFDLNDETTELELQKKLPLEEVDNLVVIEKALELS